MPKTILFQLRPVNLIREIRRFTYCFRCGDRVILTMKMCITKKRRNTACSAIVSKEHFGRLPQVYAVSFSDLRFGSFPPSAVVISVVAFRSPATTAADDVSAPLY